MLVDHLSPPAAKRMGSCCWWTKAPRLPLRLLEELRMITNLVRDGEPTRARDLERQSAARRAFRQPQDGLVQPAADGPLLPSSRSTGRKRPATCRHKSWRSAASRATCSATTPWSACTGPPIQAIPRLINQVCDHALILAGLGNCQPFTAAVIEEAWADSAAIADAVEQRTRTKAGRRTVVEFGGLDDAPTKLRAIPFHGESLHAATSAARLNQPNGSSISIQEQLAELDDDFHPAGSIGPEVELGFGGPSDPFSEQFEQEEVVIDRYSSLDGANLFRDRPS